MALKSNSIFWICLLLSAFLVRVGVAIFWEAQLKSSVSQTSKVGMDSLNEPIFFFGDSDSYWKLGQAIAFGRSYEFDEERHWQIFRTPGYPVILAPIFKLFGNNPPTIVARIQGALFGTLNVALVGLIAWKFLNFPPKPKRWVANISGVFVAFDPTLVFQSVLILSEESFLTFALLQNMCLWNLAQKLGILPFPARDMRAFKAESAFLDWKTPKRIGWFNLFVSGALLGVLTAATVYLRPSWYYYLPFATIIIMIFRAFTGVAHEIDDYYYTNYEVVFSWKKLFFTTTVVLAFTFVALSPWIVRNYKLTSQFVPTTLQMGASLYDGLNSSATGASDMEFVDRFREEEIENPSSSTNVHFEVRLDTRMKEAAINWVKSNPQKAFKLCFVKIYRLWAPLPRERAFAKPILKVILAITFIPIFLLGLAGGVVSLKRKGAAWTLLIPAVYVTALHSIFVSSIRYRTPVLYGFSILAAYFVLSSLDGVSRQLNTSKKCLKDARASDSYEKT